ncbi:MAG: PAS domain-containing protein, partial [Acidobacteria bacterium]|nr:PAS domain-containing protein [Acidobacteriota bacterium]
ASLNLLKMAREGLHAGLRAALARAQKRQKPFRQEGLQVKSNGGMRTVNVEIIPVQVGGEEEEGLLVVFEEPARAAETAAGAEQPSSQAPGAEPARGAPRSRHRAGKHRESGEQEREQLKQELSATREYLQSVIEQQEAANEELQSANEEVQSANEELQSINEEMETSKEEIQSSNEELATVNEELQHRNLELDTLNDDLINLLASVQVPIVMLGQDLCVRRFTPMAQKVFNLIAGDIGRPIGDIKLRLSISDLEPLLLQVIDSVTPQQHDVQDAQGRWHVLHIRPYKTQENKIDGAVIVLIDVDHLIRAWTYAESIVAAATQCLLVLDGSLRVKTVNHEYCATFGVELAQTLGRPFFELGDGQWDTPELHRLMEEVLPRRRRFDNCEVTLDLPRVGRKTLTISARELPHEGAPAPFTLVAIDDITERKTLESTLEQRAADLAAADRAKNEFLALLAHELRNPLAPLANALTVLETEGAGEEALAKSKEMMGRQVQHMSQMIDDLLDVSRITQGKIRLRKQPVDLGKALSGAVEMVQAQVEARGQMLSLELPRQPVWVAADPTRLEQVFGNLLTNACKFTPKGGGIAVRAERVHGGLGDGGTEVVVRVKDDGMGIDSDVLPHVFDLFVQADRSLERARGGLGIGLTLVRRLVELHGGRVEAHSDGPGKGAELVVRLPVLERLPAAAGVARKDEAADAPAPPVAAPRRVLVVDDNLDTAESLAMLLHLKRHQVQVANG